MRKLIPIVLLLPRLVFAEPVAVTPIPPGDDIIVVLKKGQIAPFTGQLFDQDTSLRWANYLQQYRLLFQLDAEYQKQLCLAEIDFYKKKLDIKQAEHDTVSTELRGKVTALEQETSSPPFYRSVWFGVVLGVVGTVGIVASTAALATSVR